MKAQHSGGLLAMLLLLAMHGTAAFAQLPLPQLPSPLPAPLGLPQLPLPAPVTGALGEVTGATRAVDLRALREVRNLRVRELLRGHRDTLERDPRGQPVLRLVLLALSPADAALQAAQAAGFVILQDRTLEGLGGRIVSLLAPRGLTTRRALDQLRRMDPGGTYDFNHVYLESAASASAVPGGAGASAQELARTALSPVGASPAPPGGQRIGLIDGGVQAAHPAFKASRVHAFGCNGAAVPSAHGTAVASLLVGQGGAFHGAAPGFALYAADVYCGADGSVGGLVDWIGAAFAWLARESVPVVNISLVGPPNVVLEGVIRLVQARGMLVVAAVGNDGPAAKPLYPASYPGVIGVTAVDRDDRVLIEAARGPQVTFAAPGAQMAAATLTLDYVEVRGTSFAAPVVAGLLAASIASGAQALPPTRDAAVDRLAGRARDLGRKGIDSTYGRGLVGADLRIPLAALRAEK